MQEIKNIVFDYGCVLVDLDKQRAVDAFKRIDADEIAVYIDECKQEDLFHELEMGDITLEEFCDKVREKCPRCKASDKEILDAWNALLTGIPERRLERIRQLREHYRLFILSNTNWLHWQMAVDSGLPQLVERVFLSCAMHTIKPNKDIFQRMLDEAGIRAEETLFIDDSRANCSSAETLGIHTMHVTSGDEWLTKSIATIGFFDGVHRGHQFLINTMKEDARKSGMLTTVITFDRHPREVLHSDYQPQLLSTFDEKRQQIESTGVDRCAVVPFTKELSELSAYDFMRTILKEQLNVYRLYIGYDHRFGHDRSKGFEDYVEYGRELGIDVVQSTAFQEDGVNISSSVIRRLLQKGDVETATKYLGRPYTITGTVVSGEQEGRKIGFPTANIHTDPHKLIPAPGAYAVEVTVEGSATLPAMMNIGTRPTYTDKAATTIEVHILDFNDDIYGKQLTVRLVKRLREEHRFDSPEALRQQLQKDAEEVRRELRVESL